MVTTFFLIKYSTFMKFSFRIFLIFILTSIVIASCKKEDDNINNDINPNGGGDNVETVFGCMVDTACNYNNLANVDNESCDYSCYGCTDELAFNFDSEATIDDGSCVYASQLMVNNWAVESNCDGFIMSQLIDAGAGNDLIIGGNGAGDDSYDGGSDIDTIKYTSATDDITVDLSQGTATSTNGGDAAGIGSDTLSNIENIIGGNYNDQLIGDAANNIFTGEKGE